MDGAAHQLDADGAARLDQARELLGFEALQPRPQADVGGKRGLRLHADEPLDCLLGWQIVAPQQQLPRKQRTVERVPAEDFVWQG
jgi:hypothetical protein